MYGSAAGVAALAPRYANRAGRFDETTAPTGAQVTDWLTQVSAMFDVALAGQSVATPVTNATVAAMLAAAVNAHVAAMVLGVNGQGRFAERTLTADAMLLAIEEAAAAWATRNIGGVSSLLGVVLEPVDVTPPAVAQIGSFTRRDAFTGWYTEYARDDTI